MNWRGWTQDTYCRNLGQRWWLSVDGDNREGKRKVDCENWWLWELVTCRGNGENPIRCKSWRMEWKVSDIPRGRKLLKNRWGKENQFHFEHTAFNLPMGHDKYTWLEVSWNCRSEVKSERRVGWKSLKCNQANKMGNLDSPAHVFFFFFSIVLW